MFGSVIARICALVLCLGLGGVGLALSPARAADSGYTSFSDAVAKELQSPQYQKELPPTFKPEPQNVPTIPKWVLEVLRYGLMIGAAIGLAYLAWHVFAEIVAWRRGPKAIPAAERTRKVEQPRGPKPISHVTLEDADALAGSARWADAIRLLFKLAIMDMIVNGVLRVSQEKTGREIARLARKTIVGDRLDPIIATIEFGLFARRPLTDQDYQRCRNEYLALSTAVAHGRPS